MVRCRSLVVSIVIGVLLALAPNATAQAATTLAGSAGCGKAPGLASGAHTIQSGGQNRSYIVRVPAGYDNNHPYRLIFGFHWRGGSANDVDSGGTDGYNWSYYGLRRLADNANNGTIFVAPQGNGGGWGNPGGQDVTFVDDLLRQLEAALCVDTAQVFAGGFSYGGAMSYALACARPTVFRAVAVYSGANLSGCAGGTQPVAYIGLHGIRDNVLPIAQGRGLRDTFVRNNGCAPTNPPEPANGSLTHIVTAYSGCRAGYPVVWAAFDGAGHDPGPRDGCTCDGWQTWTSGEVWKFITQFGSTTPTPGTPIETGVNYTLAAQHSGKLMDISGASTAAGALLQQWAATGGLNQQFTFVDSGGGYYRIKARHSGLVLQVASSNSGADISQQPDSNATGQQWRVVDQGGSVSLVNRLSGLAMDVWGVSTADGGRISQWTSTGSANQRFQPQRS
ncbi:RICIN domain-containing protein [Amycolatopsis sp. NPDC059657]|uniref:RICIN domain-containing protein n=1 Tax=Amycolatopsis sp. NPDC059657 TaxID=3346899 RepID=UPI0036717FD5